jgi:hypothetical protein
MQGMEELIKQAFIHVDVIGPHVHEGHYDLVSPSGEIILPQIWESMVQPGWDVTMHMWPMPEPPPPPPPAAQGMFPRSDMPPPPPAPDVMVFPPGPVRKKKKGKTLPPNFFMGVPPPPPGRQDLANPAGAPPPPPPPVIVSPNSNPIPTFRKSEASSLYSTATKRRLDAKSPFFKWTVGANSGIVPRKGKFLRPKTTVMYDKRYDDDDDDASSIQPVRKSKKGKGKGAAAGDGGSEEVVERLLLKWTSDEP